MLLALPPPLLLPPLLLPPSLLLPPPLLPPSLLLPPPLLPPSLLPLPLLLASMVIDYIHAASLLPRALPLPAGQHRQRREHGAGGWREQVPARVGCAALLVWMVEGWVSELLVWGAGRAKPRLAVLDTAQQI